MFWNTFEFAVKKLKFTDNIFSPSFYMHRMIEVRLSVHIRNVNTKQHMEIVNTSAEGASLRRVMLNCDPRDRLVDHTSHS